MDKQAFINFIRTNNQFQIFQKYLDVYIYLDSTPIEVAIKRYNKAELVEILNYLSIPYSGSISKEQAINQIKNAYYALYRSLVIRGTH